MTVEWLSTVLDISPILGHLQMSAIATNITSDSCQREDTLGLFSFFFYYMFLYGMHGTNPIFRMRAVEDRCWTPTEPVSWQNSRTVAKMPSLWFGLQDRRRKMKKNENKGSISYINIWDFFCEKKICILVKNTRSKGHFLCILLYNGVPAVTGSCVLWSYKQLHLDVIRGQT